LRIHAGAERGDLILLDEAGAGTDPAEGAALAAAIIDEFRARGTRLLATSHFAELKQYAHVTPGVVNGAVEFDLATLRPTYRLIVGTPGGSQAFAIAEQLGLPASLLAAGQARRSDQGVALDASLTAAAEARNLALEAQHVAEGLQRRADEALQDAVTLRRAAQEELQRARRTASAAAAESAAQLLAAVDRLREALAEGSLTPSVAAAANAVQVALSGHEGIPEGERFEHEGVTGAISVGESVRLRSGARGEVLAVGADGKISVALGGMRLLVERNDIEELLGRASGGRAVIRRPSVPADAVARLDVRGARVEDALIALEARIDALLLAGGERLEIIHGVGTGALRDAIRRRLRELAEVREVRDADSPGRDGVTIALL
jgi:DNA mismatch repair protein MutS2